MSFPKQGFPQVTAPIADASGRMTQPWYQLFISLWNKTGQAAGAPALSGANSDITSLSGLTTPLSIPQGGTSATTAAAARATLGAGTVTSVATGAGLTGGPITGSGTIAMDVTSATYQHAGRVAQVVSFETGAVATGTTVIPVDDTIPQQTEGDQYMSLSITPTNALSTLLIDVVWIGSFSLAGDVVAALFQDATANALAVGDQFQSTGTGRVIAAFRHKMTAGTILATTFKVRAGGGAAGATTFNGGAGGRLFGGVMASSITITEILP